MDSTIEADDIRIADIPDKVLISLSLSLNPSNATLGCPGWKLLAAELNFNQREITVGQSRVKVAVCVTIIILSLKAFQESRLMPAWGSINGSGDDVVVIAVILKIK